MRWIGADAVDRALDYRSLIEALRAGHIPLDELGRVESVFAASESAAAKP